MCAQVPAQVSNNVCAGSEGASEGAQFPIEITFAAFHIQNCVTCRKTVLHPCILVGIYPENFVDEIPKNGPNILNFRDKIPKNGYYFRPK